MCSEGGLPSEMQDLELAIHHHQSLYEQVTQAYTEVRTRQDTHGSRVCVGVGVWREHWVGVGRRERPLSLPLEASSLPLEASLRSLIYE